MPSSHVVEKNEEDDDVQAGGEATTTTTEGKGEDDDDGSSSEIRVSSLLLRRSNIVDQLFLKQELLNRREEDILKRSKSLEDLRQRVEREARELEDQKSRFESEKRSVRKYKESEAGRVRLNVGGERFETSIETLREKSGFFKAMFSGAWDTEASEVVFIDRCPKRFPLLLNFLRSDDDNDCLTEYCYETASREGLHEIIGLLREAEFYQIDAAVEVIEEFVNHTRDLATAFDTITLNVGGELFATSRRTLCLCPFFDNLLAGFTNQGQLSASKLSGLQPIFLDRNPKFFAILLDYLRSGCCRQVLSHHISLLPDELLSYFKDDMKNFYELD
ncbi:hypothetical protein A3770_09p55440 [Chloropicon primus]|uniref:BTB domain-containing protein n=2 Tax=Chloropicon primus TaxID=1764295 RepID=A0A5B8MRB7_9CHLO|nr:hypothetical protein A3770_09p55440 [Chloropicon primus]|eukprot:QDZ23026.1 hypothetical protein A3770_09p55440 [Chloropicon primus]